MKDLISWYNRNRRKVFITIIFLGLIFLTINYIKNLYIEEYKNKSENQFNTISSSNIINQEEYNDISVSNTRSGITKQYSSTVESDLKILDDFISYCNSGDIEKAYELISDDCKEVLYTSLENFREYYDNIFKNGKKNVEVENWINKTYKIEFYEDALSTGEYSKNSKSDYITIVKNDDEYKLNINGYIKRTTLNKEKKSDDITIKIIYKDTYYEYETYTFEITNNREMTIALGDIDDYGFTYLEDENGLKYNSYATEMAQDQVVFGNNITKMITIKYFSRYTSTKKINKVVFPNIILNYYVYKASENKNADYTSINIIV